MEKQGLLDFIADKAGCVYLSDLRISTPIGVVSNIIDGIDANDYTLWEWEDAIEYLTGHQRTFDSAEQAADYLKDVCSLAKRCKE